MFFPTMNFETDIFFSTFGFYHLQTIVPSLKAMLLYATVFSSTAGTGNGLWRLSYPVDIMLGTCTKGRQQIMEPFKVCNQSKLPLNAHLMFRNCNVLLFTAPKMRNICSRNTLKLTVRTPQNAGKQRGMERGYNRAHLHYHYRYVINITIIIIIITMIIITTIIMIILIIITFTIPPSLSPCTTRHYHYRYIINITIIIIIITMIIITTIIIIILIIITFAVPPSLSPCTTRHYHYLQLLFKLDLYNNAVNQ
jgi:hypothetical protein